MLDLLKQIHDAQSELDTSLSLQDEKVVFYKEFFDKYNCNSATELLKVDTCDLVIAALAAHDDSLSITELKDSIYPNRSLIESLDHESLEEIVNIISNLENLGILEVVIDHLENGTYQATRLRERYKPEYSFAKATAEVAQEKETTPQAFAKFLKLLYSDTTVATQIEDEELENAYYLLPYVLEYKIVLDEFRREREIYDGLFAFIEDISGSKIKSRKKGRLIATLDSGSGYNAPAILKVISSIRRYSVQKASEEAAKIKKETKERKSYEDLADTLYKALSDKNVEAKVPEKVVSKVPNANIRTAALRLIYNHNMPLYEQKEQEYVRLAANDTSHYQVLLAKYGISPDSYEVGTVMNSPLADVEIMLQTLIKLNFDNPRMLLGIIQTSNLETITNYATLVEKGIITNALLQDNPTVLNPSSKDYENMMRNLALVQEKKINPYYFTATEEILLTKHQVFSHNIETLESYQLTQSMKTGMDSTFLSSPDLTTAIDTLLELGYEQNLEKSIGLLNYRDRFNRLQLLKALNIPVETTDEMLTVLTTDKFFVPDSNIDSYLYNAAKFYLPSSVTVTDEHKVKSTDLAKLEDFDASKRTYEIAGVPISKNKVMRNLSRLSPTGKTKDRLIYSILSGSTLTDEETNKIVSTLSDTKTTPPVVLKK